MEKYGRLKVLKHNGDGFVDCLCDCGKTTTKRFQLLRIGKTKSCGCLRRENGVRRGKSSVRHGEGRNGKETAEYRAWAAMLSRCNNEDHRAFKNYGARGIRVCERWSRYEAFLEDMGRRPSDKHSIDRIDNDGDYCPENCKWSTPIEQNRNNRNARLLTLRGKTMTATEWSYETGIGRETIYARLKRGWTVKQTLTTPTRKKRKTPPPVHP